VRRRRRRLNPAVRTCAGTDWLQRTYVRIDPDPADHGRHLLQLLATALDRVSAVAASESV